MSSFYPAIHVWDYPDGYAALRSIGIVAEEAEFCLSGIDDCTQPNVFEVVVTLQGEPCKSALVLMERTNGLTGLWFGLFQHLRDTPEGAIESLVDELLSGAPGDPPTVDVFEWTPPKRSLQ